MKNVTRDAKAASVRAKLLNLSVRTGVSFDTLAQRYAVERLLIRIQNSLHNQKFILKGAMVFLTWGIELPRPTRDLDLMGLISSDPVALQTMFREILATSVNEDGLTFDSDSMITEKIRDESFYPGVALKLHAMLGVMRVVLQVDIGIGDSLIPAPIDAVFPSLLGGDEPTLRSYSRELVVAEKFEAIIKLGELNTRMKDFFDIWYLATHFDFEAVVLKAAIKNTFQRRGTEIPYERPLPLSELFFVNPSKQNQWNAFLKKSNLASVAPGLTETGNKIWYFLEAVINDDSSFQIWSQANWS